MKNKKAFYIIVLLLVVSGVCITGGVASYLIKKPLAPPLSIDTAEILTPTAGLDFPVPLPTSLSINVPTATSGPGIDFKPTQTQVPELESVPASPTPTEKIFQETGTRGNPFDLCGINTPQSILLIAVNKEDDSRIHRINFIRLVSINPKQNEISVFAISQNTSVSGQMLDRLNIPQIELGEVYNYVINNASGKPQDIQYVASNYLAQSLFDAFGFVPSHFITFDASSAITALLQTDTLSITTSDVNQDVNDIIKILLLNQDDEENEFKSQNIVMLALLEYLQDNDYKEMASAFSALSGESVISDLNPAQFSQYFCILDNIDQGMITFQTLSN